MHRTVFRGDRRGLPAAAACRALLLACMHAAISTSHASPQPIVFAQGCDLNLRYPPPPRRLLLPSPLTVLFSRHTPALRLHHSLAVMREHAQRLALHTDVLAFRPPCIGSMNSSS